MHQIFFQGKNGRLHQHKCALFRYSDVTENISRKEYQWIFDWKCSPKNCSIVDVKLSRSLFVLVAALWSFFSSQIFASDREKSYSRESQKRVRRRMCKKPDRHLVVWNVLARKDTLNCRAADFCVISCIHEVLHNFCNNKSSNAPGLIAPVD